ncbi:MAG: homoserine kinase [Anaerolineae bacterium]|nr:homoserine kinase [Anaerolineae bacterium]
MQAVRIQIPATTANLGPGFDSLGMALGLYNTVEINPIESGISVEVHGEGSDSLPADENNLVVQTAFSVFRHVGEEPDGLHFKLTNRIPPSGGMGSSAAAIVGGVVAANEWLNKPLDVDELLQLATRIEGHPDNVTPAMLGGLVVCQQDDEGVIYARVPVADLTVVVCVPRIEVSTRSQRAGLPDLVPMKIAAASIGRAALVVQALTTGDTDLLGKAMHDELHEPYRKTVIPGADEVFKAAFDNGAVAVALSGAGPGIIAHATSGHEKIGAAMVRAFEAAGQEARSWPLTVDQQGAQRIDTPSE